MKATYYKGLTMRPIKENEVDQFSNLMKYVFQVSKKMIDDEGKMVQKKSHQLKPGTALGWFDKDKLISQIVVLPFQVNIHGVIYEMGGVTGVGTYPEYAGHGLMNSLMKESLKTMRESGQYISYLFPYSIPYYRKKGWEIISDMIEYQIKDTQLPRYRGDINGRVRRVNLKSKEKEKIYNDFAKKTNGAMIRNTLAWEERFREETIDLQLAVYYTDEDVPEGYLFYRVLEEKFYIEEMIYLNEEARRGLWNFISAHFSMVYFVKGKTCVHEPVAFLLEDSEIKQTIAPYYMGRIVDVLGFLKQYPFERVKNEKLILHIDDPILEWNKGIFTLEWNNEKQLRITYQETTNRAEGVFLTIQTLTTMLLSYKRPTFLKDIGRIKGDDEMIKALEDLIPDSPPCFFDYF
ncbi:GNAT family N-acetyltransferase [Bacillus sp. DX1.1]|uniref:GNAT family N-acetyltransferase n=1 Tax=unclassified Bacillus (in: firmicutes) TaxID=185979 RepID=UPI0025700C91|nr:MULTISPECIES: GNAT family N-acetyltransferase [unclassified Bacillus (in: firmicutes)]MDM5155276.1 GNAT family N-acetyltransferase [Bacillus sp. DX1.1]WJE79596.1 GNAT family N-acetyltransferase [Bacillus sp. DX3.1]